MSEKGKCVQLLITSLGLSLCSGVLCECWSCIGDSVMRCATLWACVQTACQLSLYNEQLFVVTMVSVCSHCGV